MLVDFSPLVRIETAPVLRTEVATEELLADTATAKHYKVGATDAANNVIELGKPFTYLDYRSPAEHFRLYKRQDGNSRYELIQIYPTYEAALVAAEEL